MMCVSMSEAADEAFFSTQEGLIILTAFDCNLSYPSIRYEVVGRVSYGTHLGLLEIKWNLQSLHEM